MTASGRGEGGGSLGGIVTVKHVTRGVNGC
jgi:hypothetical protein